MRCSRHQPDERDRVIHYVVSGHQAGQGGPAAVCPQQQHDSVCEDLPSTECGGRVLTSDSSLGLSGVRGKGTERGGERERQTEMELN